jgi:hypothetical protein
MRRPSRSHKITKQPVDPERIRPLVQELDLDPQVQRTIQADNAGYGDGIESPPQVAFLKDQGLARQPEGGVDFLVRFRPQRGMQLGKVARETSPDARAEKGRIPDPYRAGAGERVYEPLGLSVEGGLDR